MNLLAELKRRNVIDLKLSQSRRRGALTSLVGTAIDEILRSQ
jgi:hypothetical protein